jgi:hypothetical protein
MRTRSKFLVIATIVAVMFFGNLAITQTSAQDHTGPTGEQVTLNEGCIGQVVIPEGAVIQLVIYAYVEGSTPISGYTQIDKFGKYYQLEAGTYNVVDVIFSFKMNMYILVIQTGVGQLLVFLDGTQTNQAALLVTDGVVIPVNFGLTFQYVQINLGAGGGGDFGTNTNTGNGGSVVMDENVACKFYDPNPALEGDGQASGRWTFSPNVTFNAPVMVIIDKNSSGANLWATKRIVYGSFTSTGNGQHGFGYYPPECNVNAELAVIGQ